MVIVLSPNATEIPPLVIMSVRCKIYWNKEDSIAWFYELLFRWKMYHYPVKKFWKYYVISASGNSA